MTQGSAAAIHAHPSAARDAGCSAIANQTRSHSGCAALKIFAIATRGCC